MDKALLMDAIGYLPDDLVERTDKLRQTRPVCWQRWAAVAAGLVLILGAGSLWLLPQTAEKSNDAAAPEQEVLADVNATSGPIYATVETVEDGCLTVVLVDGTCKHVDISGLAEMPELTPGMKIWIYLSEDFDTTGVMIPEKIVIEEA